jgi:demethylmenaquinone methyltransferase/2-methoxy-6-polyprenyl-1,4-benzoquinol methylase
VRRLFQQIAGRYVLMNRIITFGRDAAGRRLLVESALVPKGGLLLDVGSGTGDVLLEVLRRDSRIRPVALDLTPEMMEAGRKRTGAERILWCCGYAANLPFPEETFDAVVSAYLLRNVGDVRPAVREQVRVLRRGGRVSALDTSPPPPGLLRPLVLFHLRFVIPFLGQVIARNRPAYEYLPSSTRAFLKPEELVRIMEAEGLREVCFQRLMLGTQVLVSGVKGRR